MQESHTHIGRPRRVAGRAAAGVLIAALIAGSQIPLATSAFAADAVAGALTAGDTLFPNQGNGGYDALHYDINIAVNVAISSVAAGLATTTFPAASTSIQAVTTGAPLSSYAFDFQGSTSTLAASTLNVDSVTVNGVPATFSRIETTTVSSAVTDVHKLIVTPATPVDGAFTTVVNYSGRPVIHSDTDGSAEGWNSTTDGATFVNQPVGAMTAFPSNNTPRDKATYTISVDAPTKLNTSAVTVASNPGLKTAAVVSNGELVSRTPSADGSRTTWVWNEAKPMATELSLISVGRYDMYTSNITLASGRTIPEWTFIDPAISVANQTATLSTRAQLKSVIDFFETKYGPYPGNSTGLVTDVVPSTINYALETQDRSFFPNSASRGTTYHEVMHQWWGDGVSPTDWNDIWLNEGPATYAETQLPFESSGLSTTASEQTLYNSWNTTATTSSLWAVPVAAMTQASQLFGTPTYTRGAMSLAALRTAIGDSNFETLMRQNQLLNSGSSKRTADFIALAQSISGKDLSAFFQSWIYTTGKPAWPAKWNVSLTAPTTAINPGDAISYTLSSRNVGKVVQTGSIVTVDLADILDDATLGTLPANTTLSGTTLSWAVPSTALAATSTVAIPVTVNASTTGHTLAATATTTAAMLGATCFNCASSVVIGASPVTPAAVPTITGTPVFGQALTADTSGWAAGTAFTYQWTVDNTPIAGATAATFVPDIYSIGLAVRVQVTGTNGAAAATTQTSAATALVTRAAQAGSAPTITGTPQMGKPLTVTPGNYPAGTYYTYQWLANGVNVTGATGPIYTPAVATQIGQTFTATVTATKGGYTTTSSTSAASAVVLAGEFASTPTPTITGTLKALSPLTAVSGQWDDGTTLTYAWSLDGTPVAGATTATYTPAIGTIGQSATVAVTGSKPGFPTTVKTSAPVVITPAAQVLTPTPLISGTVQVNHELTLTPGTWDSGTTLAYQWFADGTAIGGATGLTYTPSAGTVNALLSAAVTSTKANYETVTKSSAMTAAVAPDDLTQTPVPTIDGTSKVGVELAANAGTWDAGTVLTYAWYADGSPIANATSGTFTPGYAQLNLPLTVSATGTKTGFATVVKTSAATDAVAAGDLADTPVPTIDGLPKVGEPLVAVAGTWDTGTVLSYQWFADGVAVDGATEATFTPGPTRAGAKIAVAVTGTKPGYTVVVRTSDATGATAVGDLATAPVPTIVGTAKVDVLLTALAGTWDADTSLAYQWYLDGVALDGATASEFTPVATMVGAVVSVTVTGTKDGYATSAKRSADTGAIAKGDLLVTPTATISGIPMFGELLSANAGEWGTGVILGYQWSADGVVVNGATSAEFTPGLAEIGTSITVAVTGTKDGYSPVTTVSEATVVVSRAALTSTPVPTITGTAGVGETLVAVAGEWDTDTVLTYSWSLDGEIIPGATASTYTPQASAVGGRITVSVTGTRPGYVPVTISSASTAAVVAAVEPDPPAPTSGVTPPVGVASLAATGLDAAPGMALGLIGLLAGFVLLQRARARRSRWQR